MKKLVRALGILAVAACLCMSLVACADDGKKGDDKIEVVAVSEQKYESVEKAATAYVAAELKCNRTVQSWGPEGETTEEREVVLAEYVSHEKKGDVDASILNLSDEAKTGLASAEKLAVKAKVALAPETGKEAKYEEVTQTVYALKYGDSEYKYAAGIPETGERLTNSYLKSVTDYKKFANCTATGLVKGKEETDDALKFSSGMEYKFAANAMYATQYEDEERFNNRAPGGESESYDYVSYAVASGSRLVSVNKTYNSNESKFEWRADRMPEKYDSLAKVAEETIEGEIFGWFEDIPAALYTKTAGGFEWKVAETTDGETETSEMVATVSDGKIVKVVLSLSNEWEDEGTKYSEQEHQEVSFGAFGSTTVTVPDEVIEAVNKLAE